MYPAMRQLQVSILPLMIDVTSCHLIHIYSFCLLSSFQRMMKVWGIVSIGTEDSKVWWYAYPAQKMVKQCSGKLFVTEMCQESPRLSKRGMNGTTVCIFCQYVVYHKHGLCA